MPPTTRRKAASRSGNPATRAAAQQQQAEDKYAPNVWLANGLGGTEDVLLPSGQLVLVRRPGVEGLIKAGVLKDLDSLSALVSEEHIDRAEGKAKVDIQAMVNDEERMANINRVVDKVVCYCVLKPEVHPTPDDVTLRKPGVVYANMIDIVDKMYLFNYVVGGTRDLESFRGELDELLGSMEPQQEVSGDAE